MLNSRWFRPAVCTLEDRTVPAFVFRPAFPSVAATHHHVILTQSAQAGSTYDVTVRALDVRDRLATTYTGTIQFSLLTPDGGAVLPANYTFTAQDKGTRTFQVSFAAIGSQTLIARDTAKSSIAGSATTNVFPAPFATRFVVQVPTQASIGVPTPITVYAVNASNEIVPNYTGTISFAGTSMSTILPPNYTFTANDQGQRTFYAVFQKAGSAMISVKDSANSAVTGSNTVRVSSPQPLWGSMSYFNTGSYWNSSYGWAYGW